MEEYDNKEYEFLFDKALGEPDEIFAPLINDDLLTVSYTGTNFLVTENTRFIVHTSTIPLAHIWNITSNFRERYIEHDAYHCDDCMLEGSRYLPISEKCPCLEIPDHVHEVCFLRFIRSLESHHRFTGQCADQAGEFAFCKDSDNIFSDSYSRPVRDQLQVSGFPAVILKNDITLVYKLLRGCYWFKFSKISLSKCQQTVGFHSTLKSIKQAIYTINSLLIKLFYTVCDFSYKEIAMRTAELFDDLMIDYCTRPVVELGMIRPVDKESSVFLDIKMTHKHMKTLFNDPEMTRRLSALEYPFHFKSVEAFYEPIIDALNERYNSAFVLEGTDYTTSLSWKFCMSLLVQTRSLGYLPKRVALFQDQQYRNKLNEPNEPITTIEQKMIVESIQRELKLINYPSNTLGIPTEFDDDIVDIKFDQIMSEVEMPIKKSASYHTILSEGGRLEDCRLMIHHAIETRMKIPVRDLHTNQVRHVFYAHETKSYSKICFWVSYQLAINYIIARYQYSKVRLKAVDESMYLQVYHPENYDLLNASIVHIQEPGKQRNLTKSTSPLTWFLIPGSKMLQGVLSEFPEHKVGLKSSADAWKFQQRLSSRGDGRFIYNPDGSVKPFYFAYSDWTEATDNINRYIGLTHLKTLMNYSGFPIAYKEMILHLLALPQPVREVKSSYDDPIDQISYSGQIRKGFMMGNPMTKTILHLLHVSERGTAIQYLDERFKAQINRYPGIAPESSVTKQLNAYVNSRV